MSSGIKLTIVAVVAFALGFAGARLFPGAEPAGPSPAENLAWERAGGTVRLTAKSPDSGYLILQKNVDTSRSAVLGPSKPFWSVDRAMNVEAPMIVYELRAFLDCPNPEACNRCNQADDCPPGPLPPDFLEDVQGPDHIDLTGRMQGWLPLLDRKKPGIPDLPGDR